MKKSIKKFNTQIFKFRMLTDFSSLRSRNTHESVTMGDTQHFCLRWNNYQSSITSAFENLRDDEDFVDVTLACDGKSLKAHRVVLSACSPYFRELLKVRKINAMIIDIYYVQVLYLYSLKILSTGLNLLKKSIFCLILLPIRKNVLTINIMYVYNSTSNKQKYPIEKIS